MKFAMTLLVYFISSSALAVESVAENAVIQCQLSELRTRRIIQMREAVLDNKPTLLMFSDFNVMGTVRDFALSNGQRRIELELKYQEGMNYSRATSENVYDIAQKTSSHLAAVSVDTGSASFRGILELSCRLN